MPKTDALIRTKIRLPSTRSSLVPRTRLQNQIEQGLKRPLTLVIAPAGFGKTTLVASSVTAPGMPVAWLSLDKNDNEETRFLNYILAALQEVDHRIGSASAQLLLTMQKVPVEKLLTGLINDLDVANREMILVLDDYHFISSGAVHEVVAFLLEHCPNTLHLVIASRSDPPLPLARLRARAQVVELRAADLRFTETEATQFLNDIMGLHLDAKSVAVLEERTEGWIAGLQMAALSMRDRKDVIGFIEGFSGTNRYILDYLVEEILAGQSPEIQSFLLYTSILERLTAPLCDAVLANTEGVKIDGDDRLARPASLVLSRSASILEYLERANLFLVSLDDERVWYRYHHLFADLLRAHLQKTLGSQEIGLLHLRASEWHERNSSALEAIHHASLAFDFERIERLIEQNYIEMLNRGEMSGILRFWMGKLSKELVSRRPWLCLYKAFSHSWFGELEEASLLLNEAKKRILGNISAPGAQAMLGYHDYVQSRVTAMRGDTQRAIELCLTARDHVPPDNLGLQIETGITLGYEYFLVGDFKNANKTLREMIQVCHTVGAINNPVAAYAILARICLLQSGLHDANALFQTAARLIPETGSQYHGAIGLVEVGIAAVLCEWNDLKTALVRVKKGLELLPSWGKADDLCLAYITLSRIQFALGDRIEAVVAIEKAFQLIQTGGVFSEARSTVETAQVKMWLANGDRSAVDRWMSALEQRLGSARTFRYEDELIHIVQARVLISQNKPEEATRLLSCLEEYAQAGGRTGRLIEITILKALAQQAAGDTTQAEVTLTKSLTLAQPGSYTRIFLDEGRPMQLLLTQWLERVSAGSLQSYAIQLLTEVDSEIHAMEGLQEKASTVGALIDPLSPRELEVLDLMSLGKTNSEIARQLIVARGTIKAHTASIYRKLDAKNRTEAVARARQLGILS